MKILFSFNDREYAQESEREAVSPRGTVTSDPLVVTVEWELYGSRLGLLSNED
jgi:hypothetical protein